jgi:hypothetical protein
VVERVTHQSEDIAEWDTSPGRRGRACNAIIMAVWWFSLEKPPSTTDGGVFGRVWPQISAVAVSVGIRGGTWRHHEGCAEAKKLCVERVAVRSKHQEMVHFAPAEWIDSMYLCVV